MHGSELLPLSFIPLLLLELVGYGRAANAPVFLFWLVQQAKTLWSPDQTCGTLSNKSQAKEIFMPILFYQMYQYLLFFTVYIAKIFSVFTGFYSCAKSRKSFFFPCRKCTLFWHVFPCSARSSRIPQMLMLYVTPHVSIAGHQHHHVSIAGHQRHT